MPLLKASTSPTFNLPGVHVTGLASPSRGARETSLWRFALAPGTTGTPHTVDREEIFVSLAGRAVARLGEETVALAPGDTLVVPPHVPFSLANPHAEPFEALAALPAGGRAALPGEEPFTPPWAV
jgi:mannose-6-phosphate isomerase-like protein (cupin superfamily)